MYKCTNIFYLDSKNDLPIIAGSAAAGGIALAIAIITVVILLRKYIKIGMFYILLCYHISIKYCFFYLKPVNDERRGEFNDDLEVKRNQGFIIKKIKMY